jgi:hypothetical protein
MALVKQKERELVHGGAGLPQWLSKLLVAPLAASVFHLAGGMKEIMKIARSRVAEISRLFTPALWGAPLPSLPTSIPGFF